MQPERYWIVKHVYAGFEFPVFIYGTEQEMQRYCQSEFGYVPRYSGATEYEVAAGKALRMKFYLA